VDYDAVVIGSGIGGLTAALTLARAGQRVLVLEQHYLPGGWAHSFALEGYTFSPGVHYVGEVGPTGGLRRLLEGLGVARHVRLRELSRDGYDHLCLGGERYDVPAGRERHIEALGRRFPRHAAAITRYFRTLRQVYEELQRVDQLFHFPDVLRAPARAPTLFRFGFRPLASVLDACGIDDPLLRGFLTAQCGNHGLAPDQVSFPVHAAMIEHYLEGGYYPVGGARRLVAGYLRELRAHRGEIRLSTRVSRILLERGRAVGVELATGERIRARTVISNADPAVTYGRLLDPTDAPLQRWRAKRAKRSVSALSLLLATDLDLPRLGYDSGNYWWYRDHDVGRAFHDMQRRVPTGSIDALFVAISTLKDPAMRSDGRHTLEMFTFVPWEPFAQWGETVTGARPADYEAHKRALEGRMLDAAERVIPGLRDHVVFSSLGTPLTNDFYCETARGACYGTAKTAFQVGPFSFPTRTSIPALYQCGASTVSHGIAGAAISGLFVVRDVLGARDAMDCLGPNDGSLVLEPHDAPAPAKRERAIART
jgi:phytoene dehydrogenase-like protein